MSNVTTLHNASTQKLLATSTLIYGACVVMDTGEEFSFDGPTLEISLGEEVGSSGLITIANLDYLSVCNLTWDTMDLDPDDCDFLVTHNGVSYDCSTLESFQAALKTIVKLLN